MRVVGSIIVMVIAMPGVAAADGDAPPAPPAPLSPPSATVPSEPPAPAPPAHREHGPLEAAVRVGVDAQQVTEGLGDAGTGAGILIDGELGWRFRSRWSITAYGAWSKLPHFDLNCDHLCDYSNAGTSYADTFHAMVADGGLRVNRHRGDVVLGAGLGLELFRLYQHGTCDGGCMHGPYTAAPYDAVIDLIQPFVDAHVGYTLRFAALGDFAPQLFASATAAFGIGDGSMLSLRAGIGVAY